MLGGQAGQRQRRQRGGATAGSHEILGGGV
jgi:hypothetical protein